MRSRVAWGVWIVVLAAGLALVKWLPQHAARQGQRPDSRSERLPSLARASAWRNSAPLTVDSLADRPVALLLWSDTDPKGLAALAIADAWHRAFAPLGARVVALHVPRFSFAADSAIGAGIGRRYGYALPMADDADAFVEGSLGGPRDGPHAIVVAPDGRVVADAGDDMAAAELALRALLRESHPDASLPPAFDATLPQGVRTVELGAGRVPAGPLRGLSAGHERVFTAEFRYQEQGKQWAPFPVGGWRTQVEGLTSTRGGPANFVAIRYSAGRAGVVVTPPAGQSARLWVLRDDRWPRPEECDQDVVMDARGAAYVQVTEPRLYWIDRGGGERVLKLSPELAGVTVNAFVFVGAP